MPRNVQVVFTEDESKFLASALDRVPLQGIAAARLLAAIAEKLSVASRFAHEKVEPVRASLDQALLARVTMAERVSVGGHSPPAAFAESVSTEGRRRGDPTPPAKPLEGAIPATNGDLKP